MHLIIRYTIALANLYGLYDRTLLLDIYNQQNNENMTQAELRQHFKDAAFALKKAEIVLKDNEIIRSEIISDGTYEDFVESKAGKDYYVPEREILLNYQADDYIEPSPQYNALRLFLERTVAGASPKNIDETTHKVALMCRDGVEIQEIVDYLNEICTITNPKDEFGEMLRVVLNMCNATRAWENNGFMISEEPVAPFVEHEFDALPPEFDEIDMATTFSVNHLFVNDVKPSTKLAEQLACHTVEKLKDMAGLIGLRGISALRKAQLIDRLASALIEENERNLFTILTERNTLEMAALKRALKHDYVKIDEELLFFENMLLICGYIQICNYQGDYYLAISDEIKPVIKSIIKTKSFRHHFYLNNVKELLENITLMYGVLKLDDAIKLIQMIEPSLTATQTLRSIVKNVTELDQGYEIVGEFIVTGALKILLGALDKAAQKQALYEIVARLTFYYDHIPLAKLELYDYVSFVNNDSIDETIALQKIEDLLRSNADQTVDEDDYEKKLYEILLVVNMLAKQAMPLELLYEMIPDSDLPPTDYQYFDELYIELVKQVKSWLIKGHNKESLGALGYRFEKYVPSVESGTVIRRTKKVGRNDPCPCGSGKKYKKCCLKLN